MYWSSGGRIQQSDDVGNERPDGRSFCLALGVRKSVRKECLLSFLSSLFYWSSPKCIPRILLYIVFILPLVPVLVPFYSAYVHFCERTVG